MTEVDQAQLLGHLPPHVRDEMLRRVAVIRRYVADKSRASAETGAAELGLGMVHFKKLAHVWELHGRADRLPGAEWPKRKGVATAPEQMAILKEASDAAPKETIEALVRSAARLAAERGVRMPSRGTMRERLIELRQADVPTVAFGKDCHLVVVHAALDIPVVLTGRPPTMPVAALVVHPSTRHVLGIDLTIEGPDPKATAAAMAGAMDRIPMSDLPAARTGPMRIAMDTLPPQGWSDLRERLERGGARVIGKERPSPRRDLATVYLGRRVGDIEIRPRLACRPPEERVPYLESGQVPLELGQALEFATVRMVPAVRPAASGPAGHRLRRTIGEWLAELM